jgi:outer membrane scaffolding protein for murein synthesis (MipA/OmpV family)
MSDNYLQPIYGIEGNQIDQSKGRVAYNVDASINYSISLQAEYLVNKNWVVSATAEYTEVDQHIFDSPLVGDDNVSQIFVGLIHVF